MSIFDRIWGLLSIDLGIDLGTSNTRIALKGKGVVISEPSVVAVKKGTKQLWDENDAVGENAKVMLGKNPSNIEVVRPLKDGVIVDIDITQVMLRYFIQRAHGRRSPFRPRVIITVPSNINEVERRAVTNSAMNAGARELFLIRKPMAAAIGAGLPFADPVGSMIIDIGGGTSEVAVISLGGIVVSESVKVAGDEFNQSIIKYIKNEYNVVIGENTAEIVKQSIGCAITPVDNKHMSIRGRDMRTGMPRAIDITANEVHDAIKPQLMAIVNSVRMVLERTNPQLAPDIMEHGICMTGGTSMMNGITDLLARETGLPVRLAQDPATCTARGCAALLEHLDTVARSQILEKCT